MRAASDVSPRHHGYWILLVTYIGVKAYWLLSFRLGRILDSYSAEALLKLVVWAPLCFAAAWLITRQAGTSEGRALGLVPFSARGVGMAIVATVPMAIAALVLPRKSLNPDLIVGSGLIGPFAEELLFRGFLFTLLVRRAGWPVFAALFVSSVLFGLAHLQVVEIQLLAIVFGNVSYLTRYVLPYAAGGVLFAWLTWRWQSLWPAIALHSLMNFWWDLTTGEHSRLDFAIDPMSAAQAASAVLAIGLTLLYRRRDRNTG